MAQLPSRAAQPHLLRGDVAIASLRQGVDTKVPRATRGLEGVRAVEEAGLAAASGRLVTRRGLGAGPTGVCAEPGPTGGVRAQAQE